MEGGQVHLRNSAEYRLSFLVFSDDTAIIYLLASSMDLELFDTSILC